MAAKGAASTELILVNPLVGRRHKYAEKICYLRAGLRHALLDIAVID